MSEFNYCNSLTKYQRMKTREVNIGGILLGGDNPIRIQSMTTTDTMNTQDTIDQAIRMIKAGCEYIRITAPSINEAKNLKNIKEGLKQKGYSTPLIADIHFTPNAAEIAAEIVPKVRINPGNYADKKKFEKFEISDAEYNNELERVYNRFSPLVKICKKNGTVMRIGTNHGSLSDRIMNKYGDTSLGMVESALEFIRMCQDHNYYDIVLSMKSSNPIVMVNAYRLLVNKMMKENMNYPLHLGVTEAGDGIEGRVKSALGIGTLLEDGLGDTVRVSLTEEPEFELPVARKIVDRYKNRLMHQPINVEYMSSINPFEYNKRDSVSIDNIGGNNVPRVIIDASYIKNIDYNILKEIGYEYIESIDKWNISDIATDFIHIGCNDLTINLPPSLRVICDFSKWNTIDDNKNIYPELNVQQYISYNENTLKFLYINAIEELNDFIIRKIKDDSNVIIILDTLNDHGMSDQRNVFFKLIYEKINKPVIISRYYDEITYNDLQVNAAVDLGGLLVDGMGDGILLANKDFIDLGKMNKLSFCILQAARTRITKTEFISCPSCGRTQFDLQKTTAKVRSKTSHLKGLKIAVMGCIVNGPGEMADADYGYVGTGKQKISLYKGHSLIKKNIDSKDSINELIKLIKDNNDWVDPI